MKEINEELGKEIAASPKRGAKKLDKKGVRQMALAAAFALKAPPKRRK